MLYFKAAYVIVVTFSFFISSAVPKFIPHDTATMN